MFLRWSIDILSYKVRNWRYDVSYVLEVSMDRPPYTLIQPETPCVLNSYDFYNVWYFEIEYGPALRTGQRRSFSNKSRTSVCMEPFRWPLPSFTGREETPGSERVTHSYHLKWQVGHDCCGRNVPPHSWARVMLDEMPWTQKESGRKLWRKRRQSLLSFWHCDWRWICWTRSPWFLRWPCTLVCDCALFGQKILC